MNHDDRPMWDDPAESSRLRQLLRAGRDAAADYNVERGVVRHLANLQAGVALPEWAASLPSAKTGAVPVLAWLAVPFLAATAVFGVWLTTQRTDVSQPVVTGAAAATPLAGDTSSAVRSGATSPRAGHVEAQPLAAAAPADSLREHAADSERAEARALPGVAAKLGAHATSTRRVPTAPEARATLHAPSPSPSSSIDARGSVRAASSGVSSDLASGASALSVPQRTAAAAPAPASTRVAPEREPEPVAEADVNSARDAPHAAAAAAPPLDRADSRLEREMQMLAVTQRVLTSDPSRALRMARQGEREFSGSMFSAERRQLALLALVRLGQLEEARRLGRPFLVAYPNAPWSERLRRALATGQLPMP
jgi:hypothetical protein